MIAVAGAGTLYLAAGDRSGDDGTATVPPVVIGESPGRRSSHSSTTPTASSTRSRPTSSRGAGHARPRVDGALVDPVIVEVGTDYAATHDGAESTDIVGVFGQTAHVYTSLDDVVPLAVVVGDDPYVAVAGVDPMSFLNRVAEDFVAPDVPADGGPITMAFGDLPEGYEVIYNDGERDDVTAFVSTLFDASSRQDRRGARRGRAVDDRTRRRAGGRQRAAGWLSSDGANTSLSWPVAGDTYAYVRGGDPDAALGLARSLRWVSVDEWAQHYGVDVEAIEPGAAPVQF